MNYYLDTHHCETCRDFFEKIDSLSDEHGEFDLPDDESNAMKLHVTEVHADLQKNPVTEPHVNGE